MSAEVSALPAPSTGRALHPLFELAALGTIWGASYLFMRIAAQDFGAVALVEMRLAAGALVLLPYLWRDRAAFAGARWGWLALIGVVNSALPSLLFAWAARHAPAGIGAITSALTVPFTALVGFVCFGEAIGRQRALALATGFGGVVVLASGKVGGAAVGWPVAAGATAALCYGVGLHLARRKLSGLPPGAVAAATLGSAALLLAPFAIAYWPAQLPPPRAWGAATLLGVLCTGFAYVLYYRLVARIGAARTSTVTYLVPLSGVLWAWSVLGEPLTWNMAAAGTLILGGVAISQRAR
jgi:drug/metabolite transporter (DMT)-like permease